MPVQEGLRWVRWEYDLFLIEKLFYRVRIQSQSWSFVSMCWQVGRYRQQSTASLLTSLLILLAKSSSQLALYTHTSKHGVSRAAEVRLYGKWFLFKGDFLWKLSLSAPPLVLWADNKPCDDGGEDWGRSSAFRLVQPRSHISNIKKIQTIDTFLVSLNLA